MRLLLLLAACGTEPVAPLPPLVEPPAPCPEARAGRIAFREHCQPCHGLHAAGDGPAAAALDPPPADLRGWPGSPAEIALAVRQGSEGTAMQPWRDRLEDDEVERIVGWLVSLPPPEGARDP